MSYQIATTVTSPLLQADFEGRWARAIWYQPGASIQINDGQALPLSSRLFRFDRPARMTVVGRAAVEYGQSSISPTGAADARRGPSFVLGAVLNKGSVSYLVPGARALRLDKIVMRAWLNNETGQTVGQGVALNVGRQNFTPGTTFQSISVNPVTFDPDSDLTPPPAGVGVSAKGFLNFTGTAIGVAKLFDFINLPPSAGTAQPGSIDFGDNGPLVYPAALGGNVGAFVLILSGALLSSTYVQVQVYAHEELF